MLQRVKAGAVRDATTQAGESLSELIAGVLANQELATMTPSRLAAFLSSLGSRFEESLEAVFGELLQTLRGIAVEFAESEAEILGVQIPDRRSVPRQVLEAEVLADDLPAPLLGGIFAALVVNERRRAVQRLRVAAARGETNEQIRRAMVGARSRLNRGAFVGQVRRKVGAFTDLAVQHSASQGRRLAWLAANVERYRWQVILDSRTCPQCGPLDGQIYNVGEGPVDPIHSRCRCFSVPLTADEVDRSRATRPSADGEVPATLTYHSWLKRQPVAFQETAIGPTRARLLRRGGLSAEEFRRLQLDRNFEPMTLEDMRRRRPDAFDRAAVRALIESYSYEDAPAVACVHPLIAVEVILAGRHLGVFENANRAQPGQPPQFEAVRLVTRVL